MSINTGSVVGIGPKNDPHRFYDVTEVETEDLRPFGLRAHTVVTLVRITDKTTWKAYVKPDAKRIPWNARLMRVTTDADRRQAIDQAKAEQQPTAQKSPGERFDALTDALAGIADQELHAVYQENVFPAELVIVYMATASRYHFRAWVNSSTGRYRWKHTAMDVVGTSTDPEHLHRAFALWCEDRSA